MRSNNFLMHVYWSFVIVLTIVLTSNVYGKIEYGGDQFSSDLYNTFLRPIDRLTSDKILDIDGPDTTLMQFYPVENWEIEVCTRNLDTMLDTQDRPPQSTETARLWYDGSSVALSASKYHYKISNDSIYSADWYIQPRYNNVVYSIYLKEPNGAITFVEGYVNITATIESGSVGSFSKYYGKNYTLIGIQYREFSPEGTLISTDNMETDIALDEEASYG